VTVTFLVTIDPVKELALLNLLVHSLNLQTCERFHVIFWNQTIHSEQEILSCLARRPAFAHSFCALDAPFVSHGYPVWDLYALHCRLLEQGRLGDYFLSVHMEEFFQPDYVESVLRVLEKNAFDILLGNLRRLSAGYRKLSALLGAATAPEFDSCLHMLGADGAPHWTLGGCSWPASNGEGYRRQSAYAEDLFWIRREFARRVQWFLPGRSMYFEDVHICQKPGVCELGSVLSEIAAFPVYLTRSRAYHVPHRKYFFQLEHEGFAREFLEWPASDPALGALKTAIRMYRSGEMTLEGALHYSRRNPERTGTQNWNWKHHAEYLRAIYPDIDWSRYSHLG
jgi:hypothetical protein